jgi:NADH-quinone oxidoreductase subunit A
LSTFAVNQLRELGIADPAAAVEAGGASLRETADRLALTSIADIAVFFGVLLVGFAYVWKRGDLDWVRAVTRQTAAPTHRAPPPRALEPSQSILSA